MSENQTKSQDLLDLESGGWKWCEEGWYLPTSTMHRPLDYADAVTLNKVLIKWNTK